MDLYGRNFLTLKDFSKEEIRYFLDLAHQLKKDKKEGKTSNSLAGKNIVLLFEKTSTRTRCAFEVAALDEGAHVTFLSNSQISPIIYKISFSLNDIVSSNFINKSK